MHSLDIIKQAEKDGIELTSQEKQKYYYDNAMMDWVNKYGFDYFLTLTFSRPTRDEEKVKFSINEFIRHLSMYCYGARSSKRVVTVSTIEKGDDDSFHVHMLLRDPRERMTKKGKIEGFKLRDRIIESWVRASSLTGNPALSSSGDDWFKEIHDVPELVSYMVKKLNPNSSFPSTIVPWECATLDGRKHEH